MTAPKGGTCEAGRSLALTADTHMLVLFGTQTGKSKGYALNISMEARERNWNVTTICMNQTEMRLLESKKLGSLYVILVTSSFGCGGPPDSAVTFRELLENASVKDQPFKNIYFTVLGLGHSAWPSFCGFSRWVDERFEELGGTRIMKCGDCDDSVGSDVVAIPWMQNLWKVLPEQQPCLTQTPDSVDLEDMLTATMQRKRCSECDCYVDPTSIHVHRTRRNSSDKGKSTAAAAVAAAATPAASQPTVRIELPPNARQSSHAGSLKTQGPPSRAAQKRKISKTGYTRCPIELHFVEERDLNTSVDSRRDSVDSDSIFFNDIELFSRLGTHLLPITGARYLSVDSDRKVVHVEMSTHPFVSPDMNYVSDSSDDEVGNAGPSDPRDVRYEPGDDIGLHCANDINLVSALLERVGVENPDRVFTIGESPNAWTSFRESVDYSSSGMSYLADDSASSDVSSATLQNTDSPRRSGRDGPLKTLQRSNSLKTSRRKVAVCDHIRTPCTLRQAFTFFCDVNTPPPASFFAMLAANTSDRPQRQKLQDLANSANESAKAYIASRPSLIEILEDFPSCHPPIAELLYHLPPLGARFYSISSSPNMNPGSLSVAVSVVEFKTPACDGMERTRTGLCSSWIEKQCQQFLCPNDPDSPVKSKPPCVPVFLKGSKEFRIPPCVGEPLILIGPGTGVAPFLSFLQHFDGIKQGIIPQPCKDSGFHADNDEKPPPEIPAVWVVHGCRRPSDILYKEQLEDFENRQVVKKVLYAHSREASYATPKYVQHVIARHGAAIWEDLGREVMELQKEFKSPSSVDRCVLRGRIYVCGDISRMMKDLHKSFCDLCILYGGMNQEEATRQLDLMSREGRFVLGAWSTT